MAVLFKIGCGLVGLDMGLVTLSRAKHLYFPSQDAGVDKLPRDEKWLRSSLQTHTLVTLFFFFCSTNLALTSIALGSYAFCAFIERGKDTFKDYWTAKKILEIAKISSGFVKVITTGVAGLVVHFFEEVSKKIRAYESGESPYHPGWLILGAVVVIKILA